MTNREALRCRVIGQDYNKLRQRAAESFPDIAEILPPEVKIAKYSGGGEYTSVEFYELYILAEQMYQILDARQVAFGSKVDHDT